MQNIYKLLLIIFLCTPAQAYGVLKIDITKGSVRPLPVALPDFTSKDELGTDLTRVIEADLERSGLFESIDPKAFIEDSPDIETIPQFSGWKKINAEALLTGVIKDLGSDKVRVEFRLWDILSEKQIIGKSYTATKKGLRRIAHIISDEIYTRLTGEKGYFDSRIVYIAETGSWKNRIKRLAIMDQDGADVRYLTSGKTLVLTPRFDPTAQRIIYLAYYGNTPSIYLYNLSTGKEDLLGKFAGMSFAPRFSGDGKKVVMSVSINGNSEIFVMDISPTACGGGRGGCSPKRITNNPAIDTSPSFSPDGKNIVFNSDRGGSSQIYTMDSDGDNVHRITFGKGTYSTPVWSPRGDYIAFTRMHKGKFYIGVIRPDGSGERLLTESYLDEGPTWSPNGRVIIFTRQTRSRNGRAGKSMLYSIDITGYNERKVVTETESSDPAWSPLLSR